MEHSFEEIRNVALDILSGRENLTWPVNQYQELMNCIATVFYKREYVDSYKRGYQYELNETEREIFLEIFWDLFRQGIITLGLNDGHREFPFFKVSTFGTSLIKSSNSYFYHDLTSYTDLIKKEINNIDEVTLIYLKEAMQSFKSNCILSSTVMLGVATEHSFMLLLETLKENSIYQNVFEEKTLLQKINKFKNILDQNIKTLPTEIREDLDTNFISILSVIRNYRNQSGHPTGKIIEREQAYILLQLFVPYCKKVYQLKEYFKNK